MYNEPHNKYSEALPNECGEPLWLKIIEYGESLWCEIEYDKSL